MTKGLYYEILFPNNTTLLVQTLISTEEVVRALRSSSGVKGSDASIYNPQQYVVVRQVSEPAKWEQHRVKDLADILVD